MSSSILRPGALLLALLALCGALFVQPASASSGDDSYTAGEVLVQLTDTGALPGIAQTYNLDPTPLGQFGARPIYRLKILDSRTPPDKAKDLLDDQQKRVVFAEPNYAAQTPEGRQRSIWAIGGDDGAYAAQWAPDNIHLPQAQALLAPGSRGSGVIVAVIDTGVDTSHPALAGHLVAGFDFVDGDSNPQEGGSFKTGDAANAGYGHGTHVAGLVALTAPDANIMPLRALEPSGSGNIWVLVEAIQYAVNHGAQVINLSLSTTRRSDILRDIIKEVSCSDDDGTDPANDDSCTAAKGRGVVIVAAAGNSASTVEEYPAALEEAGVLGVGASTEADQLASFSNRGAWVDVVAPGEHILSTVPGGYGTWSGTSMASPFVAGEAALLRSARPTWSSTQIARQIAATSTRIGTGVPARIDVANAIGGSSVVFLPMLARR